MELTYGCSSCGAIGRIADIESATTASCAGCGQPRTLFKGAVIDGQLAACPLCATEDLYRQKDFPRALGLAIVIAGFVVSTVFWAYYMPVAATATLLATAALDLVLYYLVPDLTICYRCLSQCRGAGSNPGDRFAPFDLAIGERYRQERIRVEQLRQAGASADPVSRP
jgi:hypothetical protein